MIQKLISNEIFVKSDQSIVPDIIPIIIITPPIVGVQTFHNMINWSVLPYWTCDHFLEKILINGPPMIKTIIRDVMTDNPVLKLNI